MKNNFCFTAKNTNEIKGIALILMFGLHLFTYPEWLAEGNNFISIPLFGQSLAYFFGKFGGICVGIFMFLTGYGMYYSYQKGNIFSNSIKKVGKFLLKYWLLLFTFFLPIQILSGRTYFNPNKWHQELFGIYTSIVGFAWYVRFYILAMLTLPFLKRIFRKNVFLSITLTVVPFQIIYICLRYLSTRMTFHNMESIILEYFKYMSIVLLGFCFAKFDLYQYADKIFRKYFGGHILVVVIFIFVVYVMRYHLLLAENIFAPNMDIFYVPVFLFCILEIINRFPANFLCALLECIGIHSMNLWFLQSIFFFETKSLQQIIFFPKFSFFILLWNIIVLLPISKFYNFIYQKIHIL